MREITDKEEGSGSKLKPRRLWATDANRKPNFSFFMIGHRLFVGHINLQTLKQGLSYLFE